MMIKRILVGLAGTSYTSAAIRHAVQLAEQHEAALTGVTVIDINRLARVGPTPIGAGAAAHELCEHRLEVSQQQVEAAVAEFETACSVAGVNHVTMQEEGDPFSIMMDASRLHDLMVFGLRGLFEHDVIAEPHDELERLVKYGVRPLLAVSDTYREIRRVMIAYSGSMESAKTMRQFIQLKLWPDADVGIVVFDHPRDQALQMLHEAAEYCGSHGVEAERCYVSGSPRHRLLEEAVEWDADLIVMGNSARSVLLQHVFGDTALEVIRNADRPLLLSQ